MESVFYKKFEHSGYGVVCTSPSRVTSSWVSMTEAAMSFEVLYFLFKGPKIIYVKLCFVWLWHNEGTSLKASHAIGSQAEKSCRRSWIDLRTSLIIKSSVKPKKVTSFTGNLSVSDRWTGSKISPLFVASWFICAKWRGIIHAQAMRPTEKK